MRFSIVPLVCLSFAPLSVLTACSGSSSVPRNDRTIATTKSSGEVTGRSTLTSPITIPGQSVALVPFAIASRKGLFEDSDPYTRGGVLYDTNGYAASSRVGGVLVQQNVRWHNVLVRDLDSGEEWMILGTRGVIGRFQLLGYWSDADKRFVTAGLAFVAVIADTNQDGSLDDRDSRVLIVTDATGRNPRIVSPRDAQVWEVSYDGPTASVFAMIATDTNRDGRFDLSDVAMPYVIRPGREGIAQPVVSEDLKKRAESLLH